MRAVGRLTIRARITIGTLLIALLFFTGVAIVVRHQVETILRDAAYDVLTSDATPFETAIQQEPDDPVDNPGEGQLIAVIDPTGATRISTLPTAVTAELGSIDRAESGPRQLAVGSATYLVAVETVASTTGEWTIVSARNENASRQVLADLTNGLVGGLGALTLLFGVVSWLLTGAALRPVTRLRRSAEALVSTDSNELLPVGSTRDEIAALASTLNTLIDGLRAAAARERQMVSDASHELRTPLAVLQVQLELLRAGDPSQLDTDIRSAERATVRLTQLVDSLLELSRLDSGRSVAPAAVGDLLDEAGEAIDRIRFAAMSGEVEIELRTPPRADRARIVSMSPLLYGRVLDNLLSNALHAVGGRGRVVVSVSIDPESFTTTVEDSGEGMSAEFIARAFDRFSQGDSSRTTRKGSGLGLAIVAAAATAAGGTARLENAPQSGLIVTVSLPLES